jgi:tetratricopeptide (TPR) repeat protein
LDTNNAEALNGLGLARMQRDRPQEAEEFFQAAVQNHPDYAPAILNWATVEHEYLHNDHLALDEYRAYLALNPHPADWDEVNAIVNTLEPSSTPASPRHPQNEFNSSDAQNPVQPAPRQQEVRPQETKRERPAQQRSETTQSDYRPPREQTETVQVQPEAPIASAPNSAPRPAPQPDPFSSVENSQAPRQPDYSQVNWMSSEQSHGDVKVTPLPPENYSGTPAPVHIVQPAPPVFARYLYLSPSRPAAGNRRAASEMFSKAREYEVHRTFPDALDYYRRAARLDPSWFEAQYNAGVMAYRLRDYASSLASYETALAIEPDSVDARYNFALALQAAGYVTDAVEELRKIVASNPNDARTHLELGNLYAQQLRDIPRAREQYMKVLQLDPGNPQASNIQFWLSANPP